MGARGLGIKGMAVLTLLVLVTIMVPPGSMAQTEPPATGDWVIADETVIHDREIQLIGDLPQPCASLRVGHHGYHIALNVADGCGLILRAIGVVGEPTGGLAISTTIPEDDLVFGFKLAEECNFR